MNDDRTKTTEHEPNATSEDESAPVENRIGQGDIINEVSELGRKLTQAVQTAWESESRRSIQTKVVDELKTAGEQVEHLAKRSGARRPARDLHEGAEKLGRTFSDGLLTGLRALNKELTRTLDKYDKPRDEETEQDTPNRDDRES